MCYKCLFQGDNDMLCNVSKQVTSRFEDIEAKNLFKQHLNLPILYQLQSDIRMGIYTRINGSHIFFFLFFFFFCLFVFFFFLFFFCFFCCCFFVVFFFFFFFFFFVVFFSCINICRPPWKLFEHKASSGMFSVSCPL